MAISLAAEILSRAGQDLRLSPAKVVSILPLTVSIGGAPAVPAVGIQGQILVPTNTGFVLIISPQRPIFIRTV